jgi:hypothetical protein
MEDWVPGKYPDRRTPPQDEIVAVLSSVRAMLGEATREREAGRTEMIELRADMKIAAEERKALREEMKPLTLALQQARAVRWVLATMVAAIVGLAASYAWLKTHVLTLMSRAGP